MDSPIRWLASTIGKRSYIANYLRASSPPGSMILGTGKETFTPGFASCDKSFRVPPIADAGYLDAVERLCRREGVTAVVTLSDLDVEKLSMIRDRLTAAGIACFFPEHATALRFVNKWQSFGFFTANGIKTPRTTLNLEQALDEFGFPLVIKPCNGSASQGLGIVHDRATAEAHWKTIAAPMAQEFIQGRLINVESCSNTQGELLGLSVWARHTSVAGETLHAETIEHPAAMTAAANLLARSPIPGPTDMDIIERDGELYFLEVNTRFGGGYPVSHLAGADFTGAMVQSLAGNKTDRLDRYRRGVIMMKEIRPFAYDPSLVQDTV